ncbi:MAG: TRAP transporter large permease [Methylobacteriaceae bacterium]|jgi:tripartite ATP-independent transporter DctM subunit|nr:TRAP transporter large permease [Methylobacteriaceae bacterium]
MSPALTAAIIMASVLTVLLILAVPIAVSIGISAAVAMMVILPTGVALQTSAQKMFTGISSFALLAIPFFILAGNIMNNGGISVRLVNCAKLISGRLPGSLAQTNVVANMMFGAISGSGAAAAAAIGSTMNPIEEKEGYAKDYYCSVNAASAPTGMLIPPSNTMIVYATVAGSVSVAALFMAGYVPGILWGLAVMLVAGYMAKKRGYVSYERIGLRQAVKILFDATPSLGLIVVVIGGILKGVFTATEGAAIAVVYALALSFCYRTISVRDLPRIILDSCRMTCIVLLMVSVSAIMSWVMAFTNIPTIIANAMLSVSENRYVIMLMLNVILLLVGCFMDVTAAVLIFTPIFLPIVVTLGIHPVHFGIILTFNLGIGAITPPVGTILFTACKVANASIEEVIGTMMPYFAAIIAVLMLVTYVPDLAMYLPRALDVVK